MRADPNYVPTNFIHDDCYLAIRGGQTPNQINDEIIRWLEKDQKDKERRERNMEQLNAHFRATARCADPHDLKMVSFIDLMLVIVKSVLWMPIYLHSSNVCKETKGTKGFY